VKIFLSTVCLLVVICLSVSVFSPKLHSVLFHGDQACPHAKNGKPCSSHQEKSASEEFETCAVVLFGESSENFFTLSDSSNTHLLDWGVSSLDSSRQDFAKQNIKCWARGPPKLI
jgi:hypothetical protein